MYLEHPGICEKTNDYTFVFGKVSYAVVRIDCSMFDSRQVNRMLWKVTLLQFIEFQVGLKWMYCKIVAMEVIQDLNFNFVVDWTKI